MKRLASAVVICAALRAGNAHAQTFHTLLTFTGTGGTVSGQYPTGSLIASGGTLYGVTQGGGANGDGNVFSVGVNGTSYKNLLSFTGSGGMAIGESPVGSLLASGGTLYGMTVEGGAGDWGNVFSVGMNGTNYQNLASFTGTGGTASGDQPYGSLIASGTTLYGMTSGIGGRGPDGPYGNVFSVGTNGTNFQNLVSFTGGGGTASGEAPQGSLIAIGGTLYGMTTAGGGDGNVFSVGTNGTNYQSLVYFNGTGGTASGYQPGGSLIASGSTLYGMTYAGTELHNVGLGYGTIFSVGVNGTNFQSLLSFTGTGGTASGQNPTASLTLSGTRLYGMTPFGGVYNEGNIFSVGINGSGYEDLYDFTGGTDGGDPYGDLLASGGTLFGMASSGGANGDGTVFALTGVLPTPEPGTLALAGAGATALLVSYRWRRMRGPPAGAAAKGPRAKILHGQLAMRLA